MPSALAVFTCRPNSHPFQERHVYLDEPVKIGRSVARCRPAQNNATFDCKVLSRNHALVWFDHKTGKFYLQDTKSSNGTFINSQRLSRGSEESPPCEVLSGDIIQFGVDVTENTRKVTHGCIVSTIKLFLPDGMEARRRSDVIQTPLPLPVDKVSANTPSMYSQELFQLSQYLQEALHREQMLEQKLATLQRLLATTQEASESSWQALIDEDRLLSRLEVMGSQLQAYSKSQTEEGIRKELLALQEDKHNYETTAKESLRRVLQEKIEVVRKLSEVERSLSNTEDECTHLKEMSERSQDELRELANKYNAAVNEIKELTDKIKAAEVQYQEQTQRGVSERRELELKVEEMEEKEQVLQARIEALQADNDFTNERLAALQVRLEQLQEKSIKENNSLDVDIETCGPVGEPEEDKKDQKREGELSPEAEEDSESTEVVNVGDIHSELITAVQEPGEDKKKQEGSLHEEEDEDTDTDGEEDNDNCHLNNSGGDSTRIQQLIECPPVKQSVSSALHKIANFDEVMDAHLQNNQTSEDDNLGSPDRLKGICEKSICILRQLLGAQERANAGKHKCQQLQALLEEERRSNLQLTEESTKQIQYLQSQLLKLQADMEALREQRESAICSTREELYSAQEEILVLRHALDSASSEREREICALQSDLASVRSELEQWRNTATKYEKEISHLQEVFSQQQTSTHSQIQAECVALQQKCVSLQQDCDALRAERTTLTDRLRHLEDELSSSRQQSQVLSSSLESLEKREEVLQDKLGSLENQHLQDASSLKTQLHQAQERTSTLQREYEDTQSQLSDLRQRYERTEREKLNIHKELEQCKSSLKLLQDKTTSSGWSPWMPVVAVMVAVTAAILYPNLSKSSAT
ncbi:sarcolemma associated protein a [Boleophthalmus pectinirostris]|uniref:sarcolemma associated protein a n=1 Tax=Boleophthalmus pectinirostris TaxID=150288 RepID=UPI002432F4D3|nr:sarcolemma associated protein a [Boleophthalmus pectinirostris]